MKEDIDKIDSEFVNDKKNTVDNDKTSRQNNENE